MHFYDEKPNIPGSIIQFLLLNDDELVACTSNPNGLVRYSISKDSILGKVSLDGYLDIRGFTINPYNGFAYVYGITSDIYIVDIVNNTINRKITVIPDYQDNSTYPETIPYDIGFTATGYGLVLLKSNETSGIRWKVIDSAQGDIMFPYDQFAYSSPKHIYLNYDKSKLIVSDMWGGCSIQMIDGTTHEYKSIIPGQITRGVFITPNKKNDKIYFGQLYDQFIMDTAGKMSMITDFDNRENANADFSYRTNEEDYIYYWDNDYFIMLDYNSATTLMYCNVAFGLKQFAGQTDKQLVSTSDGKYIIANCGGIYLFKTESIYRNVVKN